jgi:tetratricopeptide (TPR) repeat protein/DNA-binding CsgD family transcriptional regulator
VGLLYAELGDYVKALEYYQRARAIVDEHGFRDVLVSVAGNIGNVHKEFGDLDTALINYKLARDLAEELGARSRVAKYTGNIGLVYFESGEYAKALEQHRLAYAICEEVGDRLQGAFEILGAGNSLRELGDYAGAMEHMQRALSLAGEIGATRCAAFCTEQIGGLYYLKEYDGFDVSRCEENLLRSADLSIEASLKPQLRRVYWALAEFYSEQGRLNEALEYQTKYYQLNEELFNLEAHKKVQQVEHQRQIAELEKQRAIEQAEAKAATEIERMKAEQVEKELGNTTLQLLAQTELLRDLRNDLLKIARKIPPSEPAARELRDRIKYLPCESVDWEKFDRQFKAVHPDFIRTLTERAPELTATELRICTMLRMNLKSHEIAGIFCITEAGVEFHRKNIRRKLKLEREEKLPLVLGAM